MSSCTSQEDVNIRKYPIVTTVRDLAAYYDLEIDRSGKYESASITKYLDGSYELDYEYELLDSNELAPLYYSVNISVERNVGDARNVYGTGLGAIKLVANSFDQGLIEIDSLRLPGDQTYYGLRTYEGEPSGMLYVTRMGTRVYTMMISGLYSPDHSLLTELIIPQIEDLSSFEIEFDN